MEIETIKGLLGTCLDAGNRADLEQARQISERLNRWQRALPINEGAILSAIHELVSADRFCDIFSVAEVLKQRHMLDEIGGIQTLDDLVMLALPSLADYQLRQVDEAMNLAEIRRTASLLSLADRQQIGEIFAELQERITSFGGGQSRVRPFDEVLVDLIDKIGERQKNPRRSSVTTGIDGLDRQLGGAIMPGELIVIAADAGVGKTTLGYYVCLHNAVNGHGVHIISGEMGEEQAIARFLLSHIPDMSSRALRLGEFPESRWPQIMEAAEKIAVDNITIDAYTGEVADLDASIRQAREILRARGSDLRLVMLDYLQQIKAPGNSETERVSAVSHALRRLSKEYGVAILALSAISRNWLTRGRSKPDRHAVRASGLVVNDADQIWVLSRRGNDGDDEDAYYDLCIDIDKDREGSTGSVVVPFSRTSAWIGDKAPVAPAYRARLLANARLIPGMTLADWRADTVARHEIAAKFQPMLEHIKNNGWLVLCGPNQTGKTHVACALLAAFIEETGRSGIFVDWLNFSSRVLAGDNELEMQVMAMTARVVDDYEKAIIKNADWHHARLLALMIDAGANQKPLIITTNKAPADFLALMAANFDNDRGNAINARLAQARFVDFSRLSPYKI